MAKYASTIRDSVETDKEEKRDQQPCFLFQTSESIFFEQGDGFPHDLLAQRHLIKDKNDDYMKTIEML